MKNDSPTFHKRQFVHTLLFIFSLAITLSMAKIIKHYTELYYYDLSQRLSMVGLNQA